MRLSGESDAIPRIFVKSGEKWGLRGVRQHNLLWLGSATAARANSREEGSRSPARSRPLADRLTQLPLELGMQRFATRPVEPQQQLGTQTGPLNRHRIGSYSGAGLRLACRP
jgi:hypothetical protein